MVRWFSAELNFTAARRLGVGHGWCVHADLAVRPLAAPSAASLDSPSRERLDPRSGGLVRLRLVGRHTIRQRVVPSDARSLRFERLLQHPSEGCLAVDASTPLPALTARATRAALFNAVRLGHIGVKSQVAQNGVLWRRQARPVNRRGVRGHSELPCQDLHRKRVRFRYTDSGHL